MPPQTEAIDEQPFDSRISETMRMVYGKSFSRRQDARERALGQVRRGRSRGGSAPRSGLVSPVENGGKL